MKILWVIYPFCTIFIVVGAVIAFSAVRAIVKAREIQSWPTADARLIECDLKTKIVGIRHTYEVVVAYEYSVLGRVFQNNKIHPHYGASNAEFHGPLYSRLKASNLVKVRYDVTNPSESYIVAGVFTSEYASVLAGSMFFMAGIFFLLLFHFALTGSTDYAAGVEVVQ